jgi:hypothetical protein
MRPGLGGPPLVLGSPGLPIGGVAPRWLDGAGVVR